MASDLMSLTTRNTTLEVLPVTAVAQSHRQAPCTSTIIVTFTQSSRSDSETRLRKLTTAIKSRMENAYDLYLIRKEATTLHWFGNSWEGMT